MSWQTVKLGDVAEFIRGITFKPVDVVSLDTFNAIGCMRTKNVQTDLDLNDVWGIDKRFVKNVKQIMREGDILVSSANSWNLVGKGCWIPKLNYECTFGGFVSVLRGNPQKIDAKYLYNWYTSKKIQNIVRSFGQKTTNISNLNIERCLAQELVLPPLAQQKRIAAILDKADAIKRKREQAIAKLDQLAQSIFVEMFGDIESNSKKLSKVTLKDVCLRVTDGTHQSPKWQSDGVPFLFISNIVNGEIVLKTNKYISNTTYDELTNRCRIEVGDVLYTTVGTYGNVAIVRTTEKFCFQRHIAHIKPDQNIVNSVFLSAMLYSNCVKRQADRIAKGIAQKTVNLGDICKFIIFCPSIALQEQFATRISKLEKLKASNIAALEKHNELFASLQSQAFTGQL